VQPSVSAHIEHESGGNAAGQDLLEAVVDVLEPAALRNDLCQPAGVQREAVREIVAGADKGPDDRFPGQHGVEDRQVQAVEGDARRGCPIGGWLMASAQAAADAART